MMFLAGRHPWVSTAVIGAMPLSKACVESRGVHDACDASQAIQDCAGTSR
jgi:hypothetical protein